MKKVHAQQQKKCQTKMKRKTPGYRSSNEKCLICPAKTFPKYQTNILLKLNLKFAPTLKHNNIVFKSNIQNYSRKLQLAVFFPK